MRWNDDVMRSGCVRLTLSEPKPSEVIEAIRAAFADVELGDGIGLREGFARDVHYDLIEVSRAKDERHDWSRLSREELTRAGGNLCFVDRKGLRFLLPAFMIHDIETDSVEALFQTTLMLEHVAWTFSREQLEAIRQYLRFMNSHRPGYEAWIEEGLEEIDG